MNKISAYLARLTTRRTIIVITLLTVAIVGGNVYIKNHQSSPAKTIKQSDAALLVTVTATSQVSWPVVIQASGAIAPWQEAVIGSQVSGLRLADIRVNVGDYVKRGQLLAVFDADLLRADEVRLKASWEQAEANRQRALHLKGTGGISEQDILQYVTQAEIAKAQLQSTQLQLKYAEVTAPDDGVISARTATLGAVSGSGEELFRMIRQSRLEWRGELTAAQIAKIKTGQRIDLVLPDETTTVARVRQIAPNFDSQTRLGIVYADIEHGNTAHAGMYVKGKVVLSESPAVVVPAASLVIRDGRSYVVRLLEGDRVSLQAVTIGRRQRNEVEITSGITTGDKVVVQGAGFLNEGDLVRVALASTVGKE